MKKGTFMTLMASIILPFSFTGCNSSPLNPSNPVVLTMWHNYGGDMQSTMDLLIDEFNSTIGKKEGIVIDVTAISSNAELNKSLELIINDDPGAPEMPDIFTGYPKIGIQFAEKEMLCNLDDYFSEEELSSYINAFIKEGRFLDDVYSTCFIVPSE